MQGRGARWQRAAAEHPMCSQPTCVELTPDSLRHFGGHMLPHASCQQSVNQAAQCNYNQAAWRGNHVRTGWSTSSKPSLISTSERAVRTCSAVAARSRAPPATRPPSASPTCEAWASQCKSRLCACDPWFCVTCRLCSRRCQGRHGRPCDRTQVHLCTWAGMPTRDYPPSRSLYTARLSIQTQTHRHSQASNTHDERRTRAIH